MSPPLNALCLLAIAGSAQGEFPFEYTNCGISFTVDASPKRAVTLNQGVTEIMLGLGLEESMAGTAYLDDEIWPEFVEAYNTVPVLNESTYPSIEKLMEANPDFLYGSYRSAFQAKTEEDQRRIEYFKVLPNGCDITIEERRGNATYCRSELSEVLNINSYLQTPSCEFKEFRPPQLTLDILYQEIEDIASIFGAKQNADNLISTIEGHFKSAELLHQGEVAPLSVLFLDSWNDTTPLVGACCGSINAIIEYAGAQNIFKDLGKEEKSTWDKANWTDIAKMDPDVIIVVDASWDRANEKIFNLCNNSITRSLTAVQTRRFITVPFSATTLGVRIGSLAYNLAEAVTALVNENALNSVQFSEISLSDENSTQALGKSGAKLYTRLPVFNGVDLELFCPGKPSSLAIADDIDRESDVEDEVENPDSGSVRMNSWSAMFSFVAMSILFLVN